MEWLILRAAGGDLALDIRRVREIVAATPITRVPLAARALRGVTAIRGQPIAVLDLALRLGAEEISLGKRSPIVLVDARREGAEVRVALLVEAASRLGASDEILPLPAPLGAAGTGLCAGFVLLDGALVPILDVDAAVAPGEDPNARVIFAGNPTATTAPAKAATESRTAAAVATAAETRTDAAGKTTPAVPSATATKAKPRSRIQSAAPAPNAIPARMLGHGVSARASARAAPSPTPFEPPARDLPLVPAPSFAAERVGDVEEARRYAVSRPVAAIVLCAAVVLLALAAMLRAPAGARPSRASAVPRPSEASTPSTVPTVHAAGAATPALSFPRPAAPPPLHPAVAPHPAPPAHAPAPEPASASASAASSSIAATCEAHAVVRGDTLWALAARRLGNPHRWPEIFRVNRDVLSNPDWLLPNERLRIGAQCDSPQAAPSE